MAKGSKVAEKKTQKPNRYLKAPKGAPRNTPRNKVVLDENVSKHKSRTQSPLPSRQKHITKKVIQLWIPTCRMLSLEDLIN